MMLFSKLFLFYLLVQSVHSIWEKPIPNVCCENIKECFQNPYSLFNPLPTCPQNENEPIYELWTDENAQEPINFTLNTIPLQKFQENKKLYIIVHGWMSSIGEPWVKELRDEFFKKYNIHILLVNWKNLANQRIYTQAASDIQSVGAHVAKVLEKIKASRKEKLYTWCIGFSLGAHLCGQVGRRTHFNRITALDPAGPIFEKQKFGLSKKNADFVDVIHTDRFFGYDSPLGHVDFYPNRGFLQPMCGFFDGHCNHKAAVDFMIASINNDCFRVKQCTNINKRESCKLSSQRFGYYCDPRLQGIFYIRTTSQYPFCSTLKKTSTIENKKSNAFLN